MHTYFCPICGKGYEPKRAVCRTWAGVTHSIRCPSCDVKLQLGGGTVIVLALLFVVVLGDLLWGCVPMIYGSAFFWSCMGVGVLRLVRQCRDERAKGAEERELSEDGRGTQ